MGIYAASITFLRNTALGKVAGHKFGSAVEIDMSTLNVGVSLLSWVHDHDGSQDRCEITIVVHATTTESLRKSNLVEVLGGYFNIGLSDDSFRMSDVATFQQAGFSQTPLSPM